MARGDLLALSDDGLVQLFNAGLVKRALKELAAGAAPALEEEPDGTIVARFADGTETRLEAGAAPVDAFCTCPSTGGCRHRVMLPLAYRSREATQVGTEATTAEAGRPWAPAAADVQAFEAALAARVQANMARLLRTRMSVRLERGTVPAAHLPMATVRFLVPDALSYARCDCVQQSNCEHVALALRAFAASDGADEVTLGTEAPLAAGESPWQGVRAAADAVVAQLLAVGVTAGMAAHVTPLDAARRQAEAAGAVQLRLALEALAEQIGAYEQRSARHSESEVLTLAAELCARSRAADAAVALGVAEPFETPMTRLRLISLGARLRQEGPAVRASLLMADSDTGSVMVLEKSFEPKTGETSVKGASLGNRLMAPGAPLANTGRGQLVTSVARRRADGLLFLGSGTGGKTQSMPRDAVSAFRPPLAAGTLSDIAEEFARRPLSLVRPRRRVADVRVFDVAEVLGQAWDPASQSWHAAVRLAGDGGGTLFLRRGYDAAAPAAPAVLSAALRGRFGPLRQISGPVHLEAGSMVCDPWSLGADRFIVPDLDRVEDDDLPPGIPDDDGTVSGPLDEVESLLSGAVHAGARARPQTTSLGADLAARLGQAGFVTLGKYLKDWVEATPADVPAFARAALWLSALKDASEVET